MSDFLEEIDKYLDDIMTPEEKKSFEEKVDNDSTLAEELKLQKDMRTVYDDNDWIEGNTTVLKNDEARQLSDFFGSEEASSLKESIAQVIDENRTTTGSRNKNFYFWGIAASIIVLMMISIFVFSESNYNDLYAQNIALG